MADEFAKGLGIAVGGGLLWMVLAGWYNTPSFEGAQLLGANPENIGTYGQLALTLKGGVFWFVVIGTLTFWVLIPAFNQARDALAS